MRAGWRILAAWAVLLGAGSGAWGAGVVALDAERVAASAFPPGVQSTWQHDAGRHGNAALVIDGRSRKSRFFLFDAPRRLPVPDSYRAEAWLKAAGRLKADGGGCQLDLVLFDARGRERSRHTIISWPTTLSFQNPGSWSYGACETSVEESGEGLFCNIEVSIDDARLYLDTLEVSASESILPNGDFQFLDAAPRGEARNDTPRGWRRMVSPDDGVRQADGTFTVEAQDQERFLAVTKGEGALLISATPVAMPEQTEGLVARAYIKESDLPPPRIALHQYGATGLLKTDLTPERAASGETLVSTGRQLPAAGADRLLVVLCFPQQAGTWHIRAAELVPFVKKQPRIRVHVDQVGYDAGAPVRFVVSSPVFPSDSTGRFSFRSREGREYEGLLVPLGRTEGEGGGDWRSYYFEGVVNDVGAGSYALEIKLGDMQAKVESVEVGAGLHMHETGEPAYGFYAIQRCGCVVPGWHGLCHMDDARRPDGSHVDATGGYHNAGDMHKHMGDNTPVSVYAMVCAYGSAPGFFDKLDRDANGRADILDEAVWGADWMRKMVDPTTGRVWMNVTNDIDYYGIPEHDTDGIPGNRDDRVINTNDPGDLAAYAIAAWAALARRLDAPVYLETARKVWAVYEDRIPAGYEPRQVFAAIELYRSTGETKYLSMAERIAGKLLELQNGAGWYPRAPGGPPEMKIVDEGVIPAALAQFALEDPSSPLTARVRESLRRYFGWSFRMAGNPFGIVRNYTGGAPFFFKARDDWFGGSNSQYASVAWAAYLAAAVFANGTFADEPELANRLRIHAANQLHWILGMNPLDLCMFEGKGNSERIYYHHLYAETPGHERGAVPGAIPNGIIRPPDNSDRPWFDLRTGPGSLPGAESAEPWLPHNAYYLLAVSAGGR